MNQEIKVCEKCNKACEPIPVATLPSVSEWYCKLCHKSYPMDENIAKFIISREKGR